MPGKWDPPGNIFSVARLSALYLQATGCKANSSAPNRLEVRINLRKVKGQCLRRWGIRDCQNSHGSLTEQFVDRYLLRYCCRHGMRCGLEGIESTIRSVIGYMYHQSAVTSDVNPTDQKTTRISRQDAYHVNRVTFPFNLGDPKCVAELTRMIRSTKRGGS